MDKVETRRALILGGSTYRIIAVVALPVMMNNFINAFYNLIDIFLVSHIGSTELASVTFVGPLNQIVLAVSMALSICGTSLIGRQIGGADYKKARSFSLHLILLSLFIGAVITMVIWFFAPQILTASSITGNLLPTAEIYLRLTSLSTVQIFFGGAFLAIKRAEGNTMLAMRINLFAMAVKILISWFFIYHLNYGVASLAVSTFAGSSIVFLYGIYDLFFANHRMKLSFRGFKYQKTLVRDLLIMAFPVVLEKGSVSLSFVLVNKYVLAFGESVLASYGIANKINSLFFSIISGMGMAVSVLVSQNLGAGKLQSAEKGAIKIAINSFFLASFFAVCLVLIRHDIAGLFSAGDPEITSHIVNAMSVYSASIVVWAVFDTVIGIFQGAGYTHYNLIISLVRLYCFRLPVIYIFTRFDGLGEYSIWYGMLVSNVLTALFSVIFYLSRRSYLFLR